MVKITMKLFVIALRLFFPDSFEVMDSSWQSTLK